MATRIETALFLVEQLEGVGNVTYKKMFGEYMIYLNSKPIFLLCDDTLFVKDLESIKGFTDKCERGAPYNGAKPHVIIDNIDDREYIQGLALALEKVIPIPKKKKKKEQ